MGFSALGEQTFALRAGGAVELISPTGDEGEEGGEFVGWTEAGGVGQESVAEDGEVVVVAEEFAERFEFFRAFFHNGGPEVAEKADVEAVVFNALAPLVEVVGIAGFEGIDAGFPGAAEGALLAGEEDFVGWAGNGPLLDAEEAGLKSSAEGGGGFVGVGFGDGVVAFGESAADEAEGLAVDFRGEVIEEFIVGLDEDGGVAEFGESAGGVAEEGVLVTEGVLHTGASEADEGAEFFAPLAGLMNGFGGGEGVQFGDGAGELLAGDAAEFRLDGAGEVESEHGRVTGEGWSFFGSSAWRNLADYFVLILQMVLWTSSLMRREPSLATVRPTGRPQTSASSVTKPVTKSS